MRYCQTLRLMMAFWMLVAAFVPAFASDGASPGSTDSATEEQEEKPIESGAVETVEVVAPPIIDGNSVDRYGNQTTTVHSRQIRDLDAQDLPTALRRTPGVVISRHNPVGSFGGGEGGAIYIRGLGSTRPGAEIQTLIDGVPISVGVWAHPLMDVLSIDPVGRIEVYKGARPAFLGNTAFGAINLVPKRQEEDGFATRVQLGGGSYSTAIGVVEHGGRRERWDYYLTGGYRRSNGHRESAEGELAALSGRFSYRLGEHWEAGLLLSRTDNEASDPGPADGSAPAQGVFKVDDWLAVLTLSNRHAATHGTVKLYRNDGDIDWVDQFSAGTGLNESDTLTDYANWGLRARQVFRPWRGGEIVAGLDSDVVSGEVVFAAGGVVTGRFDRRSFRVTSPYLALGHRFGPPGGWYLMPSAGFRYQAHDTFGNRLDGQVGLVAGRGGWQTHLSVARGSSYPGVYVVVLDEQILPDDNRWEDLDAERIDHIEAGVSRRWSDHLVLDLTLFRDRIEDRIVVVPPPPFPPTFDNIESSETRGAELSLAWAPVEKMSLFAGVTWLDADREALPYVPEWTGVLGLNVRPVRGLQIALDAQYVDEQLVGSWGRSPGYAAFAPVDAYFLLNGKLSYDFRREAAWGTQLFLAFENLTDDEYQLKAGYPMPGLNARAGIVLTF